MARFWPARRAAAREDDGEEALMRRARRGDADAFGLLVERHADRIYALTRRMLGDDLAEDAAQQVFLQAWQALPGFRGGARFGTWLYRIAINRCRDERRSLARHPHEELPAADVIADGEAGPEETALARIESAARQAALTWALARLSEEERLLLHLRVTEERSYEEIGELLGLNSKTVGTRLYRARARLHTLVIERLGEAAAGERAG